MKRCRNCLNPVVEMDDNYTAAGYFYGHSTIDNERGYDYNFEGHDTDVCSIVELKEIGWFDGV